MYLKIKILNFWKKNFQQEESLIKRIITISKLISQLKEVNSKSLKSLKKLLNCFRD